MLYSLSIEELSSGLASAAEAATALRALHSIRTGAFNVGCGMLSSGGG